MDRQIRELDQTTVERIAAGEVVERPASVVKELLENSLDADGSRVRIGVESGGQDAIRVSDDGIGMDEDAVREAVREHTTSKIQDISDLESGVGTLGFRGEALHAIGAVSRVTITTRPRGGDRGTRLRMEGGEVVEVESAGCPEGTTIAVEDLFYNVPARRKYLGKTATEFDHVNTIVTNYALANPDVAIELEHDGREIFATTGNGSRRETIMAVYGREVAESMIDVSAELAEGPLDEIEGVVSHPETNRASRKYISTFVNGRYVRSNTARNALVDAYGGHLASDRYPFAVLDFTLPADTVDVNVHPRKMEIRYSKPDAIKRQVRTAVEDALQEDGILRSSAPRGRSAPDQAKIEPSSTSDGTDDAASDRNADAVVDTGTDETSESTSDDVAFRQSPKPEPPQSPSSALTSSPQDSTSSSRGSTSSSQDSKSEDTKTRSGSVSDSPSSSSRSPVTNESDTQTTLRGDEAHQATGYENFPDLRVLGQLHDMYIVAEADDGLILIDQHAADERINYEQLKERFEGERTTQALANPVELGLTARETEIFDGYQDALARLGFHANLVDDRTVEVTTVPALVAEGAGPSVIRDLLSDFVGGEDVAEETVEAVADDLLSDMACYPSITGNTSLTDGSVVDLLSTLDDCENPWACPHGRPVLIHIDSDEIGNRFERDYPGH